MLLEDSNEYCIGCGTDTVNPENVSDYPIEMAEEIAKEKGESLERKKMEMTIVGVAIAIIVLVSVLAFRISREGYELAEQADALEDTDEELSEEQAELLEETSEGEESVESFEDDVDANGEVMVSDEDASGMQVESDSDLVNMSEQYPEGDGETTEQAEASEPQPEQSETEETNIVLKETTQEDAAGNIIFSTKYPEDFTKPSGNVTRSAISSRFRERIEFNVSNQAQTAVFTYLSSQQLWYRNSSNGKTRSNEVDTANYMSFFTYENGVENYLESRIKAGNPSLKNVKLVSKESYSGAVDDIVSKLSKDFSAELNTGTIGDYGAIGGDSEYAYMGAESGAFIYKYEATSGGTTVYMDFFAPYIANKFNYSSASADDRGELTEWILLELVGFQAGNKEIYDKYYGAFTSFIKESKVTREMLYDNNKYYDEIKSARANNSYPEELTQAKLSAYHSAYSDSEAIGALYQNIFDMSNTK